MLISPAFAQTTAGVSSFFEAAAPLVLVFVILYFFLIRPQQKRQKDHQAMIAAVRRGDTVVTSGGIVGKVTKVQDDGEVLVEIAEGVKVRVIVSTLTAVRAKGEPAATDTK
ncbi:MAG: preprotein translocase subunit YajC [Alphaproteobacteria bacterium]|nr:preprotein translocase subunit YajC [Alphaproteobacteria bacterium]